MNRIFKIAFFLLLVVWGMRAFALLFRAVYNNLAEKRGAFDGIVWETILLPRFDNGFEWDRVGEALGCVAVAWAVVKRYIKMPK